MGLVEGDEWRRKRKVISHTFHFDFLQSIIPHISHIIDEEFDEFDKMHP
jgi:cytochrome P450